MLKLLATALLLSSLVQASSSNKEIEEFLKESFSRNPKIISLKVKIEQRVPIESLKGWEALMINMEALVKEKKKSRTITQKMIWFTDGNVITKELIEIDTGLSLKELVTPSFKDEYYKKENLIYGNANATHKVAIFSDPLCPFCRKFVPESINTMKKQPNKFAIYYYHFPLPSLHPAAVELVKAAVAAELQGKKDVVLNLYKVNVNSKEKNVKKILAAFNKTMKTNITPADLKSKAVLKHIKNDSDLAQKLMVNGTPTMFFDGKVDKSKRKFEKVK
jgi:thiol-disulfide isomerase/thioredoxin